MSELEIEMTFWIRVWIRRGTFKKHMTTAIERLGCTVEFEHGWWPFEPMWMTVNGPVDAVTNVSRVIRPV